MFRTSNNQCLVGSISVRHMNVTAKDNALIDKNCLFIVLFFAVRL